MEVSTQLRLCSACRRVVEARPEEPCPTCDAYRACAAALRDKTEHIAESGGPAYRRTVLLTLVAKMEQGLK